MTDSISTKLPGADPRILHFLAAWKSARADRLVPFRHEFEPLNVPRLLEYVWIYKFEPELDDYVCQLAGEKINENWGRSIKGLTLREIVGEIDHPVLQDRWKTVLETPLIQYGTFSEWQPAVQTFEAERLLLPMASRDGKVDNVLGLALYRISLPDPSRPPPFASNIIRVRCDEI
jgi:hypothetical protein